MSRSDESDIRICSTCGGALSSDRTCPSCLLGLAARGEKSQLGRSSGTRLGDYELLAEIGRGGMGVVYKARQRNLNRLVVVKMIHGGVFADRKQIERFQYEARAASRLVHPNIVPIYEIGEIEGQHFFTMALYEEGTLGDQLGRFVLPLERPSNSSNRSVLASRQVAIAELMATVARAIHYAHQHGVIHRDLKPSNILLDEKGMPHVGDFSLAKLADEESGLTVTGTLLGTPGYMSPEQASGNVKAIGVLSDVYGLGAILYQLLTGCVPFSGASSAEIVRRVREEEPILPRKLRPQVNADLETICLRCLEKDPEHRYASAVEVADELDRYRRREPIRARPVQPAQRLIRWCQRKPALASMLSLLAIALIAGFTGVTIQRNAAIAANTRLSTTLQLMDSQLVDSLVEDGRIYEGLELLLERLQENPNDSLTLGRVLSLLEQHNFPLPAAAPVKVGGWARKAVFNAKEDLLAIVAGGKGKEAILPRVDPRSFDPPGSPEFVRLLNRTDGKLLEAVGHHEGQIHDLDFHPHRHILATGSWDGTAKVWDTEQLALIAHLEHDAPVWAVRFSPREDHLITLSGSKSQTDVLSVWDTDSWRQLQRTVVPTGDRRFVRYSPNGRMVAIGGSIWAWRAEGRYEVVQNLLDLHRSKGSEVAFGAGEFTADNRSLVTLSKDRFAQIFDLVSGTVSSRTKKHFGDIIQGDVSPSGHLFVTGSNDRTAQIWMTKTGEPASPVLSHQDAVYDVTFSPYGNLVATASADGMVSVWDAFSGENMMRITAGARPVIDIQFYEGGKKLAAVSSDGWVSFWDVQDSGAWPERVADASELEESTSAVRVGNEIAYIRRTLPQGKYRGGALWESDGLHFAESVLPEPQKSPAGKSKGSVEQIVRGAPGFLAVDTGEGSRKPKDATANNDGKGPTRLASEALHSLPIHSIQADSTQKRIATASEDGTARVWDVSTLKPITPPLSHGGPVYRARFSHDGTRLVTASEDGLARIWDATTGALLVSINHEAAVQDARFSEHDRWVTVGSRDGNARVWNAETGEPVTPPLRHRSAVLTARILRDGKRLAVGTDDARLRIWDIDRSVPLTEPMLMPVTPGRLIMSPSGASVMVAGRTNDSYDGGSWRAWGQRYRLSFPNPPGRPPVWFLDFLRDLSRSQLVAHGESLPWIWQKLWSLRKSDGVSGSYYSRWRQWFLGDRSRRSLNPTSALSVTHSFVCPPTPLSGKTNPEFHNPPELARQMANLNASEVDFYEECAARVEIMSGREKVAYLLSQHATYLSPKRWQGWLGMAKQALEMNWIEEGVRTAERAYSLAKSDAIGGYFAQETWIKAVFESRGLMLEETERNAARAEDDLGEIRRLVEAEGMSVVDNDSLRRFFADKPIRVEVVEGSDAAILGPEDKTVSLESRQKQALVGVGPTGLQIPEQPGNLGLELDGIDDFVRIGYLPLEDKPFTFEAWIKTASSPVQVIMNNREDFGSFAGSWVSIRVLHGVPEIYFSRGEGILGVGVQAQTALDASWNHIAVVYEKESVRWYINGNLDKEQGGIPRRNVSVHDAVLGAWPNKGFYFFKGSLDEVRVWTEARTSEEIRSNMNRSLSGNEVGLVRYYRFDDSFGLLDSNGGLIVADQSPSETPGMLVGMSSLGDSESIRPLPFFVQGAPGFGSFAYPEGLRLKNDLAGVLDLNQFLPVGETAVTWTLSHGAEVIARKTSRFTVEESTQEDAEDESADE